MEFITAYATLRNATLSLNGDVIHKAKAETLVGDVLQEMYSALRLDYPKFYKMDGQSQAGFLATEVLLGGSNLGRYAQGKVALVLSNAHSSLDTDKRYSEASRSVASPALFVYTLPNIVAGEISIRHKVKGENAFFVAESFDADLMFDYVQMVFNEGHTEACIAGWIDLIGEHHDVLVYLVEKSRNGLGLEHSVAQIRKIYK